ncbi:UDP-4-amino-4,6-dideoxy-N-acetyl-beta-L-altrosamine transaminase [Vibrio parahaemolyticus]|uniref:UDP-4-amino-4, 6-dideoxy-N-acetyl-beta-L-altrosamine transaminase n=1 Tax=Vibrio parahaemolyticus TaxID=670 RepID=UPI00111E9931|nr:UDP-4-amino-4,6-dideoxy-N-acetyl-beta-L-altrosamine transaminase [Vibrio parahaemolyticus]TPA50214.1 UDP-4-amino-4,6-dideoxy-N-acetyl-beta-L-altrosamine transaminase [Vibrio parahaemolyticus]HBN6202645.1 UDP-4-amino-4,6-dideoxy-N-acetyl-beta-L-altrosamine transaminase [Vibrio parahaemolyticus]HCE1919645.1 UDP-4-amino-4,6-dideoxy-N-acetyl-beta-L-altrosamine transaminase [Vibrio parahaemolyticus]HCM0427508.1 UDP-4-amino-4,6-dideoxy-N-acetyl-beta-L-altrosamine transaminase [Vibrio parahaemolyti
MRYNVIPYGKQDINQQDVDSVLDVLKSDFLTQGPQVPAFESALIEHTGASYALAVNSATSALHIACLALRLGQGDWLWTSPVTFVASANCGLYCGAKVDFVDIDPDTYNMCPKRLEEKLIKAKAEGKLPKVVVPVHLCGQPCDMAAIGKLAKEYGFKVIEDASHAIGGRYQDQPIGNCEYSDITVFSFHPVKIVTTAEGGAALTNSKELADKMALLRSHGITRDPELMRGESHGGWYYQQIDLGFNYRMTELQAAMGVSQMTRLNEFVAARHELAQGYYTKLDNLPIVLPYQLPNTYSGLHLFVIRLKLSEISLSRQLVFDALRERGIGVNLHYIPVHTQPYYQDLGFTEGEFPESEQYYREAISLPMFHGMTEAQQNTVVDVLTDILKGS